VGKTYSTTRPSPSNATLDDVLPTLLVRMPLLGPPAGGNNGVVVGGADGRLLLLPPHGGGGVCSGHCGRVSVRGAMLWCRIRFMACGDALLHLLQLGRVIGKGQLRGSMRKGGWSGEVEEGCGGGEVQVLGRVCG
jgi:hypothetical protein